MKVGIYLGDFDPQSGGAHAFETSIAASLAGFAGRIDHQLHFISSRKSFVEWGQVPHLPFRPKGSENEGDQFRRLLESQQIEFVVYVTPKWVSLDVPYLGVVWDLQHRCKPYFPEVSCSPAGQWDQREAHFAAYLRRAAYLFTGTSIGRAELEHFYQIPRERIRIVPLPTPNDCFGPMTCHLAPELDDPSPYFYYPAQFWPHKNHANLLFAIAALKERHRVRARLILTGADKGNAPYIRELTDSLGIADQVKFLGFVARSEMEWLYRRASALVYPSLFGPDNLPPLEAMAWDCPVLAAEIPGAREQLGEAAIFFDPLNPDDLAEKMVCILSQPAVVESLRSRGRVRAKTFTSNLYAEDIIQALNEFAVIRRTWAKDRPHVQLFSGMSGGFKSTPDGAPIDSLEDQIKILSAAAEERLRLIEKLDVTIVKMEHQRKNLRGHWWSRLGRALVVMPPE